MIISNYENYIFLSLFVLAANLFVLHLYSKELRLKYETKQIKDQELFIGLSIVFFCSYFLPIIIFGVLSVESINTEHLLDNSIAWILCAAFTASGFFTFFTKEAFSFKNYNFLELFQVVVFKLTLIYIFWPFYLIYMFIYSKILNKN